MSKFLQRFSIYELVLIAVMASLGIAVKPVVVPIAHLISGPLMIPSGALAGGFYMLWLVVGFGMTGKYGTGTLISLVQALMVLFVGVIGSHGAVSLISYTLPGFFMDLVLFLIGHRVCCRPCALIAGAVANLAGTFAVNLVFFSLPPVFLLMTATISLLSGGVGGLLSWELLKVLRNFKLIDPQAAEEERQHVLQEGSSVRLGEEFYENGEIPAVVIRNLTVSYQNNQKVLKGISLSIPSGTITVVLGLSGCGKSTLCHCIGGIIPYCKGGFLSGEVFLMGEAVGTRPICQMAGIVGTVLQNPDEQMVASTVEDELAFGLENQCVEPEEIQRKVNEILQLLKIEELRDCDPGRLSGGQKHLVAIGALLVLDPEILILDEPLSQLDAEGQAQVIACLKELQQRGKTIFVVEHDYRLLEFADRWIVLSDGRICCSGTPREVLAQPELLKREHLDLAESGYGAGTAAGARERRVENEAAG